MSVIKRNRVNVGRPRHIGPTNHKVVDMAEATRRYIENEPEPSMDPVRDTWAGDYDWLMVVAVMVFMFIVAAVAYGWVPWPV